MSENVQFSPNQLRAIELLALPKAERQFKTQGDIAANIGVNEKTIGRWLDIPEFRDAVTRRARELLGNALPEIYAALKREAEAGSYQHIKLALEVSGEFTPNSSVNLNGGIVFLPPKEDAQD